MATAKPKTKRMMFGGMAKGAMGAKAGPMQKQFMSDKLRGAPMTQSSMQAAAKQTAAKPVPAYAKPYVAAQSKSQMPSQLANVAKAYNAQKSGNMGRGPQSAMKKGGAVKKKATKK